MQTRILYVVPPSTHFAGMERVVHDVASGLATHFPDELSVDVLYCHRYPELSGELPYRAIWEEVAQLRAFPTRVARRINGGAYDIVVSAQYEPTALLWLCHRLRGGRSRFVMHLHGNPRIEGSGSRRARLAFTLFDRILPRMDKVLAVSPSLARYVEGRVGGHDGLVAYLPNPVRQFPHVAREGGGNGVTRFVSIGRLARQKGYDILIEALGLAVDRGLDATLSIVGDGTERAALTALAARLGIADRVRLLGTISDPADALAAADCFVSASRWEGFGVAIVEALSAGLYVIATDCEFGPSDLIDAPDKGRIVPSEDADALAAAMIAFARGERPDAGDRARREAAARFGIGTVVAQHAAMLKATHDRAASRIAPRA